jgi:hypothetical protein
VVFDCRWQAARRRADTLSGGVQRACRGFASEALPPLRVGTVREIDWRAVHAGVELFGERVRFLHPPFDALPARASGWSLYDAAGDRLVLVPDRREAGAPQGYDPGGRRRVVCVDDFVAAGGYAPGRDAEAYTSSLAAGLDRASGWRVVYRRLPAPEAGDSEAAGAAEDLVTLAGLEGGADDIVVLSLARRSMEHGDDPETFGLFLAAAADILGRTLNRFLVLVTPPPYTGITTDARAYAAEVHRVAAVRGMPVADLYSAVCGRGRAGSRFLDATGTDLSASGRRLAAELAAEVLRQP